MQLMASGLWTGPFRGMCHDIQGFGEHGAADEKDNKNINPGNSYPEYLSPSWLGGRRMNHNHYIQHSIP